MAVYEENALYDVIEYLNNSEREILSDSRYSYPKATTFNNAPLALIQYGFECRLNLIKELNDIIGEAGVKDFTSRPSLKED